MARNLIELEIPNHLNVGVGSLFGQPGRNMRAWIRRLADLEIPIMILVDMSPWSLRIFSTIKSNSIELANIHGLATPHPPVRASRRPFHLYGVVARQH